MTLARHVLASQRRNPTARGELSVLLLQLAFAGKIFSHALRRAALADQLGHTGGVNVQGERVKKLDAFGNQVLLDAFARTELVGAIVSEELDEPRQMVGMCSAHGLGRLDGAPPGEDGKSGEESLLARRERLVAPGERRAERLVAGRGIARAAGEEVEPLPETLEQRPRRQQLDPCRGQLESERQSVERDADLRDRRGVVGGEREVVPGGAGTSDEEGDRLVPAQSLGIASIRGRRCAQGRHRVFMLAVEPERSTARRQDREARCDGQQFRNERSRRVDPLEVVEQEETGPEAQEVRCPVVA